MGRRKLDPVEKIRRILDDACIYVIDLPFDKKVKSSITDRIWLLSREIGKFEQERQEKLIREQKAARFNSFTEPPVVKVLSVTGHTVAILCPYCGQKHIHGNIPGHVVAHCLERNLDNIGYIIPEVKADGDETI